DDPLGHFGVNVLAAYAFGVRNLAVGHCPISFKWAFEVHAHEPLPTGEVGVATRTGRMTGRGITRPAQALLLGAEGRGHPVRRRSFTLARREGGALSVFAF